MSVLLDTNILTRIAQLDHPQHAAATSAVRALFEDRQRLCIVPQNLYEFWAVATRPPGENGLGKNVPQAEDEVRKIKRSFVLLRDERGILPEWERLMKLYGVRGKATHDARLVAAMRRHNLSHLLTFNASHFTRFEGITLLTPDQVLHGGATGS